ncbi:MAG TPA: hypothetical protein VMT23_01690 [Candidatus Binatia bacterium]|nr:hypothetical protein [Candidatus Binatia bacterium]
MSIESLLPHEHLQRIPTGGRETRGVYASRLELEARLTAEHAADPSSHAHPMDGCAWCQSKIFIADQQKIAQEPVFTRAVRRATET